jgi:hypothetical protein
LQSTTRITHQLTGRLCWRWLFSTAASSPFRK